MLILFSQDPTHHSRLANSLIWMARAHPHITAIPEATFLFPWARESFYDFLDPLSPWIDLPTKEIDCLFQRISSTPLSAAALAAFCNDLKNNQSAPPPPAQLRGNPLALRLRSNGVDLAFFTGDNLDFEEALKQARDADLIIIHEPFQCDYSGPRFPRKNLAHISPRRPLIEEAAERNRLINPEGSIGCGLHIRRGDYAQWQNGAFFFGDEFWLDLCRKLVESGIQTTIFTNEARGPLCQSMANLGAHLAGGTAAQDLALMMQMDRVIGPPSTFPVAASMLAQFCLRRHLCVERIAAQQLPNTETAQS